MSVILPLGRAAGGARGWRASRFNATAREQGGRLVLWNALSGALSAFRAQDASAVLELLASRNLPELHGEIAEHLLRRGFLVLEQEDELERFREACRCELARSDLLELTLLATEECNFRCVYCYERFARGTMTPAVRQGIRRHVLTRAPELKRLTVAWFGGEPLCGWPAIQDLAPFFRGLAESHGIRVAQNMTTNGYLLDDARASALLEWGCRSFQVTLDGLAADHDRKRAGRNGEPTQQVILRNLRALQRREQGFLVAVRINFDRQNAPRLGPFIAALGRDFAGDPRFLLRFRPIARWGGSDDDLLETCGITEEREIRHQLQASALAAGLRVEAGAHYHAAPGSAVCYAARPYHFVVGATGLLMKCTVALDTMPENLVGRVHPDGEWSIDRERLLRFVSPFFETDAHCRRCALLPTCQGAACPLRRIRTGRRHCCGSKAELEYDLLLALRRPQATARAAAPGAETRPLPRPLEAEMADPKTPAPPEPATTPRPEPPERRSDDDELSIEELEQAAGGVGGDPPPPPTVDAACPN